MLAAADTFRAGAIEQLKEWSNRAGVDIISQAEGADPAAVVYDAVAAAKAKREMLMYYYVIQLDVFITKRT